MLDRTATLPGHDHPLGAEAYLIFCDGMDANGRRWQGILGDVDRDKMNRRDTVSAILESCIAPSHVICLTPDGRWSDVSEDIARDVISRCYENAMQLPDKASAFCARHLGEVGVANTERRLAMLAEALS
jgi:hypothetical protein